MQNKCPRCSSKLPIKRFLFPVVVLGYNNIDDNIYICRKCNAYVEWTINRKVAVFISYAFCMFYLYIGSSIVSNNWFIKVLLPSIAIPVLILLIFPNQISVKEE